MVLLATFDLDFRRLPAVLSRTPSTSLTVWAKILTGISAV